MSGEQDQTVWRGVRPIGGIRGVWPEIDSVRITKNSQVVGSGTTIIYTVPAGKILLIGSAFISTYNSGAIAVNGNLSVRNVADVGQFSLSKHHYIAPGQFVTPLLFSPALEVLAGWDVIVSGNHVNMFTFGQFNGWLEDE